MNIKQFIQKYIKEIIVIFTLVVMGITIYYINIPIINNKPESCQELREDLVIKDNLIKAYRLKDKTVTRLLKNNNEIISNQDIMIINLELMLKDQENMLKIREQQIKLLGGD